MTATEHLLTCLAEECGEVMQNATKSLRFGLADRNVLDPTGPTNRERLVDEPNDLMGVADMLADRGMIPKNWRDQEKQDAKRHEVAKFMDYAASVGALQITSSPQHLARGADLAGKKPVSFGPDQDRRALSNERTP